MSTLKPNKLSVAKKQVSNFDGVKIPETINENEKHLVHVLIIDSRANQSTMKFEHKVRTQMFHVEAFSVAEKKNTYPKAGVSKMVVFHDPRSNSNKEDEGGNQNGGNQGGEVVELPSVEDSIELIDACTSVEELNALKLREEGTKNRKTVLGAIVSKIAELGE